VIFDLVAVYLILLNNIVRSCKYTHNYSTAELCAEICEGPRGFEGVTIEVKLDKYCSYLLIEFFKYYFYSLDLNIPRFGTCRKITGCHCNGLDQLSDRKIADCGRKFLKQIHLYTILIQGISIIFIDQMPTYLVFKKAHSMLA